MNINFETAVDIALANKGDMIVDEDGVEITVVDSVFTESNGTHAFYTVAIEVAGLAGKYQTKFCLNLIGETDYFFENQTESSVAFDKVF